MRELETERLLLRRFRAADLPRFTAYRSDPEVARYQSWTPDFGPAEAERFLDEQDGADLGPPGVWLQLAATDRASGALAGDCAVSVVPGPPRTFELGVTMSRQAQGRGLAREATAAVVARLFAEHDAHRVTAVLDERNEAAARLLAGLGFREEARLVEADWCKGEWVTLRTFAMLEREAGLEAA